MSHLLQDLLGSQITVCYGLNTPVGTTSQQRQSSRLLQETLMMGDQAKSDVSPRLSKRRRHIVFDSNADGATDSTNIATSGPKLQEDNGNHINDTDVAATDADGDDEEAVDSVNATVAENWATR